MSGTENDKSSEEIFNKLEEYMFTRGNMAKYNKVFSAMIVEKIKEEKRHKQEEMNDAQAEAEQHKVQVQTQQVQVPKAPVQAPMQASVQAPLQAPVQAPVQVQKTQFTPFQKDTLFWCFYIILHGFDEYELHNSDHFSTEKNFKIAAVEKFRTLKVTDVTKFKESKLKKNEIEDELVNQERITLKGLHALCLLYEVSITYIYDHKYCEFIYAPLDSNKSGVIVKNKVHGKDVNSVKYDTHQEYMDTIHSTFWKVENIQKPLHTASYYTVKDLQDICKKLQIPLVSAETGKNKLKTGLYEDILKTL